jgi:hypothetical protein
VGVGASAVLGARVAAGGAATAAAGGAATAALGGAGELAAFEEPPRASAKVSTDAAAADANDEISTSRLELRWTWRKSLAATTLRSEWRGSGTRRGALSLVSGARVCSGADATFEGGRGSAAGRSKLMVAAGRA